MNDICQDLNLSPELIAAAAAVRVLLMDVDGVFTNGTMFYVPGVKGEMVESKGFNSHDGLGLHLLHDAGLSSGVISGLVCPGVAQRARILGMTYVYQGHLNKESSYQEILDKAGVTPEQVAFIGDDFTDVPVMRKSGLAVAVANARPEVKAQAHYVTSAPGGQGAVREVAELILKAQKHWPAVLKKYQLD